VTSRLPGPLRELPPVRLLFLINNPDFFISHRLPVGLAALKAGYEVHVAAPDGPGVTRLRRLGFQVHLLRLSRSGASPLEEIRSLAAIYRLYRQIRPDLVHHVTIKPVLYGTFAARFAGVPAVVNAFSGLGFIFIQRGWRASLRRFAVNLAYRFLLRHPRQTVIFQNHDDLELASRNGWVGAADTRLIRGSGVDLNLFQAVPETPGPLLVVLPARLLWDKGIREFAGAARQLQDEGVKARFALVGSRDAGNPASATEDWLEDLERRGILEVWGQREDMHRVLGEAHIVCLPSYREGLPKSLIEAAACGRPIVTTDVPGCREVIREGEGGFLVPAGDTPALAAALRRLLEEGELRRAMGLRNRREAERSFGIEGVVRDTLAIYEAWRPRFAESGPNTTFPGDAPSKGLS
jgi:glycosyltransferase involved in cell wall biosynthesis